MGHEMTGKTNSRSWKYVQAPASWRTRQHDGVQTWDLFAFLNIGVKENHSVERRLQYQPVDGIVIPMF